MGSELAAMVRFSPRRLLLSACAALVVCLLIYVSLPCEPAYTLIHRKTPIHDKITNRTFTYERTMPLIFVGGVPRSGTTLMRAILDAHPDVRCGEETRVIPRIIGLRNNMLKSKREVERLREAGISDDVMDAAMAAFILEVIARHGEPASRLCNKDPLTMKSTSYLYQLFPNAKFILMVRDGRAVVHSIITRRITITGFDLNSYDQCLRSWNRVMENMYVECQRVGGGVCLQVQYEQLVLHPRATMETVLSFLDIPWNDAVMRHEEFVGKPGGVSLSKTERSTSQVIKPVNLNALSEWVGKLPADVMRDMGQLAPMLGVLGYDPAANPPKYGRPDVKVSENTMNVRKKSDYWQRKEDEIVKGIGIKPSETDTLKP